MASAAAALVVALVTWPAAASAHPFGAPPTADIALHGADTVRVHWKVGAADDLSYLAGHLGLLPSDRVLLDGAIVAQPGDPGLLAGSAAFDAYVLAHVAVTAGDRHCRGSVGSTSDLLGAGVDVDFSCGAPVSRATVEITMLTDMNPLYTTLATGPGGQTAAYAGSHDAQEWTFSSGAGPAGGRRAPVVAVGSAVAAVLAGGLVALVVARRRRTLPGRATTVGVLRGRRP